MEDMSGHTNILLEKVSYISYLNSSSHVHSCPNYSFQTLHFFSLKIIKEPNTSNYMESLFKMSFFDTYFSK